MNPFFIWWLFTNLKHPRKPRKITGCLDELPLILPLVLKAQEEKKTTMEEKVEKESPSAMIEEGEPMVEEGEEGK